MRVRVGVRVGVGVGVRVRVRVRVGVRVGVGVGVRIRVRARVRVRVRVACLLLRWPDSLAVVAGARGGQVADGLLLLVLAYWQLVRGGRRAAL